jgi:hypothetical protein
VTAAAPLDAVLFAAPLVPAIMIFCWPANDSASATGRRILSAASGYGLCLIAASILVYGLASWAPATTPDTQASALAHRTDSVRH